MALLASDALQETLAPLGADPLELSEAEFAARIGERGARIKALLLDQRVLRGLGNIYADESLWRAKIHPARLGARLTKEQAARLYRAVPHLLRGPDRLRGLSLSHYLYTQ